MVSSGPRAIKPTAGQRWRAGDCADRAALESPRVPVGNEKERGASRPRVVRPCMVIMGERRSPMAQDRRLTALASSGVLLSILSLGVCATDARAEDLGPPKTNDYPAVEDVPPRPEKPAMTADEQLKLKKELTTARDRQAPKSKAGVGTTSAEPGKP
jgi:hypothetical protein